MKHLNCQQIQIGSQPLAHQGADNRSGVAIGVGSASADHLLSRARLAKASPIPEQQPGANFRFRKLNRSAPGRQQGLTSVEFAIIGSLFMLLLLGIIEFGRLLYTWHALNETTRRAARLATVCQVTDQTDIVNQAIMDGIPIPGFGATNLALHYLDNNGADVEGDLTDPGVFNRIHYIRATVENYTYQMLLPLFPGLSFDNSLLAPDFSTTLPRESLGITRPSEEPGGGATPLTDC